MKKFVKSYALVGQKALIFNSQGKVLLLRRSTKTSSPGRLDFVGGGLDRGEDPLDGIKREIEEETGLKILKIQPIIATSHFEGKDFVILIFYKVRVATSAVKLSWEHDDYQWVSRKEFFRLGVPEKMKEIMELI